MPRFSLAIIRAIPAKLCPMTFSKTSTRPLSLLAAMLLAATLAFTARAEPGPERPKTPLARQMSEMGKNLRALKKQIGDPAQNPSSIELVGRMEKNAAGAKTLVPARAKEIPEAEREKWIADYKARISDLEAVFGKMEKALRENRNGEAQALMEKLGAMRREGHEKFNAEEQDKK